MPYLEGTTLRGRVAQGPLPIAEAVSLLRDVARALAYAHEHGIAHRDIKPENVLLTGGMAMVTDFGIAKALTAATGDAQSGFTTLGVVLGTPAYMAPEQGAGDPATDHRADIYAFGCLAYEALSGSPPFAGRTPAALIAAHAIEAPEPLTRRRADVPPALAELVMRCLAKQPADRPQSAAEVLRALEGVPVRPRVPRRRVLVMLAGMIAILAALAVIFLPDRRAVPTDAEPGPIRSVAVLPFVNTGGDPGDEYFSDGMTDELAHALAGLPDIRVAGRTSSYAYKGRAATVQEIGRSLGVQGVISGTVRRAGERLRVTVQLASAADGFQRWSHEYERRLSDVFELQDELTQAIVSELEPALLGTATRVASGRRGTEDPVAYEHYLRGRYFWERRGTPALLKSIDEYHAAVGRDSAFARAWAGLAMSYVVLPAYTPLDVDSLTRLSIAAARRALAIDSGVVDAHLALATALGNEMRLRQAEAEFRRVLALAPNDPTAWQWYSTILLPRGKVVEALEASRRASSLDPLSAVIINDQAVVLLCARRYEEAFAAARRALELDSTFVFTRAVLAWLYGVTGHPDSALAQLGLDPPGHSAPTWRGPGWRGIAVWAYGLAGRREDLARMRAEIARHPGGQPGYDAAMAAMAVGDLEGTVRGLALALERHELLGVDPSPGCNPVLDPLHQLRSFRQLLARYDLGVCER